MVNESWAIPRTTSSELMPPKARQQQVARVWLEASHIDARTCSAVADSSDDSNDEPPSLPQCKVESEVRAHQMQTVRLWLGASHIEERTCSERTRSALEGVGMAVAPESGDEKDEICAFHRTTSSELAQSTAAGVRLAFQEAVAGSSAVVVHKARDAAAAARAAASEVRKVPPSVPSSVVPSTTSSPLPKPHCRSGGWAAPARSPPQSQCSGPAAPARSPPHSQSRGYAAPPRSPPHCRSGGWAAPDGGGGMAYSQQHMRAWAAPGKAQDPPSPSVQPPSPSSPRPPPQPCRPPWTPPHMAFLSESQLGGSQLGGSQLSGQHLPGSQLSGQHLPGSQLYRGASPISQPSPHSQSLTPAPPTQPPPYMMLRMLSAKVGVAKLSPPRSQPRSSPLPTPPPTPPSASVTTPTPSPRSPSLSTLASPRHGPPPDAAPASLPCPCFVKVYGLARHDEANGLIGVLGALDPSTNLYEVSMRDGTIRQLKCANLLQMLMVTVTAEAVALARRTWWVSSYPTTPYPIPCRSMPRHASLT